MRIPHHRQHHQAPVTYLQPTNNNAIISANTISVTENSAVSSLSVPAFSLTSSTTTGTTALVENLTISNNYSSHLRGLNGNDHDNDNNIESSNATYDTTTFIERNDNVNLMLSSSNANYHALNYTRTQSQSPNQNQQNLNKSRQKLNLIHQNLNQNQDNLNQWKGGGGRTAADREQSTEVLYNNFNQLNNSGYKHGNKTDANRIQCLMGNNGNDEVADTCDTKTSSMQIFEGNLNVLEEEKDTTQTQQGIIIPDSNVLVKFSNNHIEFKLDCSETNVQGEVESEPEDIDEDENLYDLDEKIQNVDNTRGNLGEDKANVEGNFQDVEVKVVNNSPYQFQDDTKINIAKVDSQVEASPKDGGDIVTQDSVSFKSPSKHSNLNEANITTKSKIATGALNTENSNLSDAGQEGISVELTRQNFTKLDLEKNCREEEQQHLELCHQPQPPQLQNQHQHYGQSRSNRSRNNYQRHQDNSLSSNSPESSPDDSLMDDEDLFSDTPSSFASLDSTEPGHYPRGIINPNYPGFQHLAHTLSEHFVNHHLDQDDSDLSEFEVELSVESLDESFESYHRNNNMIDGSLNNNNVDEMDIANEDGKNPKFAMDTRQDNIDDIHDHVNYNTSTDMIKNTCLEKELNLPEIRIGQNETSLKNNQSDSLTDINSTTPLEKIIPESITNFYSEELCCDLDTYLKKFETVTDIKSLPNPSLIEDATRNCPTPDILIKNDKKSCRKKSTQTLGSSENRPDLLRNVSPNSDSDCSSSQNGQKKLRISVPDNIQLETKGQSCEKQDELNSYSITPVDIVGDFGREVEHEFGLIVSGYNSIGRFCDDESISKEISNSLEKMTDATLTDCKEEISVSSEMRLSARSLIHATATSDCTTCDLIKASTPAISQLADEAHTQQNLKDTDRACKQSIAVVESATNTTSTPESQNSDQPRAAEHLVQPAKITNENSNENIICNGPIDTATKSTPTVLAISSESGTQAGMLQASANVINSSIIAETAIAERLIPTAIVKPKYQKPSYDERQLPPIGLAYCSDQPTLRSSASHKSYKDTHHPGAAIVSSGANVIQTSDSRSRKICHHLPVQSDRDRDRFVKYSKKSIGRTFQSVISSRSGHNRKDISSTGSCVAIVTPRKKDKMENYTSFGGGMGEKRMIGGSADRNMVFEKNNNNSGLSKCNKTNNNRKERSANAASFDVYNIETALPAIDLEAIENHLKKAKEEERKRRNDREEIRRRLAMGAEDDYFSKIVNQDRPGRKPSLQSRLQSGMNLQICFMNEASSDTESPSSDSETCPKLSKSISNSSNMSRYSSASSAHNPYHSRPLSVNIVNNNNNTITNNSQTHANNKKLNNQINRPSTLSLGPPVSDEDAEADFFTKQARLQIEARMALAQAKDMAHMQMEIERQKQKTSPITEVIRNSMEKVGVPFPPEKRRVSRQMLTDMNIAQLQIIVNDLHSQIERLNEQLVQYLMERDDLHMGQDSMLVDIEDLTRYLGAKEQTKLNKKSSISSHETTCDFTNQNQQQTPINSTTQNGGVQSQNKFLRIANLVKK